MATPARQLRLALIQDNPVVGDLDANAARILAARAAHTGCDLVVFTECFLSGYPLEDLVLRGGFIARVRERIQAIAAKVRETPGPAVLFGAPIAGAALPHNAAVLVRADGSTSVAAKAELPNADVFDEVRVFAPAEGTPRPLQLGSFRLGAMVCEDMWHGRVSRELADELADLLIVINGSPFEENKLGLRVAHARRRVADTGLPLIYTNQVGGQDELVFDGASFCLDARGHLVCELPFGEPGEARLTLTVAADGTRTLEPATAFGARQPYPERLEQLYRMCLLGLRDYCQKNGASRVLLGVSGGVDSALVLALACDALGSDRVTGLMMPSRFTSQESLDLAADLMARLGVRALTVPIADTVDAAAGHLVHAQPHSNEWMSLAQENLQARIRGLTLMAYSNAEGGIVLSTGNKSEMSVGYSTLYGDMCGGFNPIKDLYKTDVWAICHWRNAHVPPGSRAPVRDPIPRRIIERPPTAELKSDQTDEATLGSYEVLDRLLRGLVEGNLDAEAARREAEAALGQAITPDHARRIAELVRRAEYKRRQAPPGLKLTARSFGKGWRYPIVNRAEL